MHPNLDHLEAYRVSHPFADAQPGDRFGAFILSPPPHLSQGWRYMVIVSDGDAKACPWEHVSVHCARLGASGRPKDQRTPSWDEMCWIKDQFFLPEEAVMQLHPPASEHINLHPHCLHLWRPLTATIPMPPRFAV